MARKKPPAPAWRGPMARATLTALIALFLVVLPCTPLLGPQPTRLWKGYQTLLLREDIAQGGGLAAVESRFGPGVVSERTARVDFWDFTGLASVPVAEVASRIDPSDPRFDRFIEGAGRYTTTVGAGRAWKIAYIPSTAAGAVTWLRLSSALGTSFGGRWMLLELDPVQSLVSLAAFLAFVLLIAASSGGDRRTMRRVCLAAALAWAPYLLGGGLARLAVTLVLYAAWSPVMRTLVLLHGWDSHLVSEMRRPLALLGALTAAALVVTIASTGLNAAGLCSLLGAVAASILLLVALGLAWGRLPRRRRRKTGFDPVPIVRPPGESPRSTRTALVVGLVSLALVTAIPLVRPVPVPTPSALAGVRGFSWGALAAAARDARVQHLPDYTDLVTHEAYQESLGFGRPWHLPYKDESITVHEYRDLAGSATIVETERRVKVFDSPWLESVARRCGPGSIGALLRAQGRVVIVEMRGPSGALLHELPLGLLAMIAFAAMLTRERGFGLLIRGILLRFNVVARRNQVP